MALKPLIAGQFYNSSSGGSPGGSNGQVQYNNSGAFGGLTGLTTSGGVLQTGTFLQTGLGTTPTAGLTLINSTAAAAGAQQVSPSFVWSGRGWKTDATAASQAVEFRANVLPVQGTANPTGLWQLQSSINGGAFGNVLTISELGALIQQGPNGGAPTFTIKAGATNKVILGDFSGSGAWLQLLSDAAIINLGASNDVTITRKAAATVQFGADAAGVTNQMLTAANRTGSDGPGANLTVAPGNGLGGAGGSLIFSTFTTGATGVAGTLTTRFTLTGSTLTGGTGASLENCIIGGVTPAAGTFTTLATTGNFEIGGSQLNFAAGDRFWRDNRVYLQAGTTLGWAAGAFQAEDLILLRDAANVLALRNSSNPQAFRVYGNLTGSHYLNLSHNGTNAVINVNGGGTLLISSLPTANPGPGILWNNAGTPAIGT